MIAPSPGTATAAPADAAEAPPPETPLPPTPWRWRLGLAAVVGLIGASAYFLQPAVGYRGQAAAGILCFLGIAACFSRSLQSVSRKTLLWGIALQLTLAVAV